MNLRTRLRNFWKAGTPQSPVARIFSMLLSGALGLSIVGLWISAASVYIDPQLLKWASLCGLAFPLFLFGSLALWVLSVLFAARSTWVTGLVGIALCFPSIFTYMPIHPTIDNEMLTSHPDQIRVLSYNTLYFGREMDQQDELVRYILKEQPQIVCFQEGEIVPDLIDKLKARFAHTSLPYFAYDASHEEAVGIVSAYPVLEQEVVSHFPGNAVVAYRLQHPKGELLVVNCHLRSNLLSGRTLQGYTALMHGTSEATDQESWQNTKTLFSKIANSAQERSKMLDDVEAYLHRHPQLPVILCGDFNDTPISFARHRVASFGLTDAFRAAGQGFGFSYRRNAIRVRIDHIFCSSDFEPIQAKVDDKATFSDHQPISATLLWRDTRP